LLILVRQKREAFAAALLAELLRVKHTLLLLRLLESLRDDVVKVAHVTGEIVPAAVTLLALCLLDHLEVEGKHLDRAVSLCEVTTVADPFGVLSLRDSFLLEANEAENSFGPQMLRRVVHAVPTAQHDVHQLLVG
jgi:hypothetical protein